MMLTTCYTGRVDASKYHTQLEAIPQRHLYTKLGAAFIWQYVIALHETVATETQVMT